jgi:hypothetical protein
VLRRSKASLRATIRLPCLAVIAQEMALLSPRIAGQISERNGVKWTILGWVAISVLSGGTKNAACFLHPLHQTQYRVNQHGSKLPLALLGPRSLGSINNRTHCSDRSVSASVNLRAARRHRWGGVGAGSWARRARPGSCPGSRSTSPAGTRSSRRCLLDRISAIGAGQNAPDLAYVHRISEPENAMRQLQGWGGSCARRSRLALAVSWRGVRRERAMMTDLPCHLPLNR